MICWLFLCRHKVFFHMHTNAYAQSDAFEFVFNFYSHLERRQMKQNTIHTNRLPFSSDMHIIQTQSGCFFMASLCHRHRPNRRLVVVVVVVIIAVIVVAAWFAFFIHLIYSVRSCFIFSPFLRVSLQNIMKTSIIRNMNAMCRCWIRLSLRQRHH